MSSSGRSGWKSTFSEVGGRSPADFVRHLLRDIEAFTGGGAQADDITQPALQYKSG